MNIIFRGSIEDFMAITLLLVLKYILSTGNLP